MPTPVKNPREGPSILCTGLLDKFLGLQPEVLKYIRYKVRTHPNPEADAQDILQRAVVKALRRAETFQRGEDDLPAWFYTIARRSIVDEHRRGRPERRFSWLDSDAIEKVASHDSPTPEDIFIIKDSEKRRMRVFLALVKRLPPQMGTMMKLRCAGYSDEEIAAMTGVSKITVRTNIYRGIQKARHLIHNLEAA
jgi:RNA polymerase sigma factor (sigma-70 family)